jgi:hypothetical protein
MTYIKQHKIGKLVHTSILRDLQREMIFRLQSSSSYYRPPNITINHFMCKLQCQCVLSWATEEELPSAYQYTKSYLFEEYTDECQKCIKGKN